MDRIKPIILCEGIYLEIYPNKFSYQFDDGCDHDPYWNVVSELPLYHLRGILKLCEEINNLMKENKKIEIDKNVGHTCKTLEFDKFDYRIYEGKYPHIEVLQYADDTIPFAVGKMPSYYDWFRVTMITKQTWDAFYKHREYIKTIVDKIFDHIDKSTYCDNN
jgi:asparagine synthetase A